MPITPFHFGPGAALYSAAPRYVSFLAFCAANVLIDVESLTNMLSHRRPVHAFFHTYIGATIVLAATVAMFWIGRRLALWVPIPDLLGWKQLTLLSVTVGAAAGAYSHIALDSIMHADMTPLAPFSEENALLGFVSLATLHLFCIACGIVGLLVVGVREMIANMEAP